MTPAPSFSTVRRGAAGPWVRALSLVATVLTVLLAAAPAARADATFDAGAQGPLEFLDRRGDARDRDSRGDR